MNKIVIVDDHVLFAETLRTTIEGFQGHTVLYEAKHGKELQEKFRQPVNIPDIVILDYKMPVMDGVETARWLAEHHPDVMTLVLTMENKREDLEKIVRSGARGILLKDVNLKELMEALDALMTTGYFYPVWVTNLLLHGPGMTGQQGPNVSDRELEFLRYAATELTYEKIAEKMFCSRRTVEGYRDSLFEKFETKSRVGLVTKALKKGLIRL